MLGQPALSRTSEAEKVRARDCTEEPALGMAKRLKAVASPATA